MIELVGEGNISGVAETELSERVSGWEGERLCEATEAIGFPFGEIEFPGSAGTEPDERESIDSIREESEETEMTGSDRDESEETETGGSI
jgi:hypothetical protein